MWLAWRGEMEGELGLGACPRWRQIGSTTGRRSSCRSKQRKPAATRLAVETNRRGGEDDLLVLFTGGTTARAEQGGGVGSEMEVGDGSVQGHAPVNKCRERQSLERRDSAKKQKEKARARGRPDGSVAGDGGRWPAPAAPGPGGEAWASLARGRGWVNARWRVLSLGAG